MDVEHGADGRARYLAHNAGGFLKRLHHVGLRDGQRLHQHRNRTAFGVRRDRRQAIDEVPGSLLAADPARRGTLLWGTENHHAVRPQVGTEID